MGRPAAGGIAIRGLLAVLGHGLRRPGAGDHLRSARDEAGRPGTGATVPRRLPVTPTSFRATVVAAAASMPGVVAICGPTAFVAPSAEGCARAASTWTTTSVW